jgi:hypothetical protein
MSEPFFCIIASKKIERPLSGVKKNQRIIGCHPILIMLL